MDNWQHFQTTGIALLKMKFDTEEQCKEAIKKFERYVKNGMITRNMPEEAWYLWCPVYGGQCRTDCVCFKEFMPVKRQDPIYDSVGQRVFCKETKQFETKTYWLARDWECRNVSVNGIIYVEKA